MFVNYHNIKQLLGHEKLYTFIDDEDFTQPNQTLSVAQILSLQMQGRPLPSNVTEHNPQYTNSDFVIPQLRKGYDLADFDSAKQEVENLVSTLKQSVVKSASSTEPKTVEKSKDVNGSQEPLTKTE